MVFRKGPFSQPEHHSQGNGVVSGYSITFHLTDWLGGAVINCTEAYQWKAVWWVLWQKDWVSCHFRSAADLFNKGWNFLIDNWDCEALHSPSSSLSILLLAPFFPIIFPIALLKLNIWNVNFYAHSLVQAQFVARSLTFIWTARERTSVRFLMHNHNESCRTSQPLAQSFS